MTPDEIKAQQAKVKAQQEELQRRGLYRGKIDGVMGESTADAQKEADRLDAAAGAQKAASAAAEREAELERGRQSIEMLKAQGNKGAADAKTAELLAKTKRKEVYDEAASSIPGIITETAAGAPSAIAGTLVGRGMGKETNAFMDSAQASANKTLAGTAADRVAGLTQTQAARDAARLAGVMPPENRFVRIGGRMAPNLALGALLAGKGALLLKNEGEEDPFYPKMANRAAGIGMLGAGSGMVEQGIRYARSPGVAPDAASIAVINSNGLRRGNVPEGPPPPAAGTRPALLAEAKAAGITGRHSMNVTELAQKLAAAKSVAPAIAAPTEAGGSGLAESLAKGGKGVTRAAIPAAAGYAVYDAMRNPAQAADGSGPARASVAEALAAGAGTSAATAGTGYGVSKLARMLAPAVTKAAGAGLSIANPGMMAGIMDDSHEFGPEENARAQAAQNQTMNTAARYLPRPIQFGPVDQAYQMAQVPEPSPTRSVTQGQDSGPLPNAAALEIPGNIPPNAARDAEAAAAAPQGPAGGMPDMNTQIQILQQHGVDPDLIRAYIAAQQQPPAQAAAAQ